MRVRRKRTPNPRPKPRSAAPSKRAGIAKPSTPTTYCRMRCPAAIATPEKARPTTEVRSHEPRTDVEKASDFMAFVAQRSAAHRRQPHAMKYSSRDESAAVGVRCSGRVGRLRATCLLPSRVDQSSCSCLHPTWDATARGPVPENPPREPRGRWQATRVDDERAAQVTVPIRLVDRYTPCVRA